MKSKIPTQAYAQRIQEAFKTIFHQNKDENLQKPLIEDLTNRQQILFMQYEMEKKGKNFGITETRIFKIEGKLLYQVNKGGQQKLIPCPESIQIEHKTQSETEWNSKYSAYTSRLVLKFEERTDIYIYFKSQIEINEVSMYILSLIHGKKNITFIPSILLFQQNIITNLVDRMCFAKKSKKNYKQIKRKHLICQTMLKSFSDKCTVQNMLTSWKSKSLFRETFVNLRISILSIISEEQMIFGQFLIWHKGQVFKRFDISQNIERNVKRGSTYECCFRETVNANFQAISVNQSIEFEIKVDNKFWKIEKIYIIDLRKISSSQSKIQLKMIHRDQLRIVKLLFKFQNHHQCLQSQKIISPKYYRLIDELYCYKEAKYQISQIHNYYWNIYNNFHLHQKSNYLSFLELKHIFELLKIRQLIQKFFHVYPFKEFVNVQQKGSFIYNYLLKDSKNRYYDVQKLIWKFKNQTVRSLLIALKVFDQNPKFIFTEPLYYLCQKAYELAYNETFYLWKSQLFESNSLGIESKAFFITLAIIKKFPGLFMHQEYSHKKSLSPNSLLFHFIINKSLSKIYSKILKIQLNIEAFFGCQFVNLMTRIIPGNMYIYILECLLEEKNNSESIYFHTLIGAFIAIMQLIDAYECTYFSAQNYILVFEEFCNTLPNKLELINCIKKWTLKSAQTCMTKQFLDLNSYMKEFYLAQAYSAELGEISQQIYQQFTCYSYKNEADLRRIYIVIDKIAIHDRTQILTLNIFQEANKLYEHEFKGVNLQKLQHFIELKLFKLEELTIICSTQKLSYSCKIDPKQFPSNYYFHFARPLRVTYQLQPQANNHIFFQAYIKDSCQCDNLENPIPQKYRIELLQDKIDKEDLLMCKKFVKTFRMRQNNFNLLYMKLGWYGCHYLIPDERILSIEYLTKRQKQSIQLENKIYRISRYTRIIYGKALCPYPSKQKDRIVVRVIKEGIITKVQPSGSISNQLQEGNLYDSANRLITYVLDNFQIPSFMHFVQFYHQMSIKLPLISYLSYQPNQFYSIPSFTLQIISEYSVCIVVVSERGEDLQTNLSIEAIKDIQYRSKEFQKMPEKIQIKYHEEELYFDDFLFYLRLHLLKKVIQVGIGQRKQTNGKKWPNSLISMAVPIPNYKIFNFYELMIETKQIIQLQFKEIYKIPINLGYQDWALIKGRWVSVSCFALIKSPSYTYFYVYESYYRKKYLVKSNNLILVSNHQIKKIEVEDQDLVGSFEGLSVELKNLFNSDY